MKKPIMGIQLYTLREHIKTADGFDSTLARLEAMGVRDVQISGIGDIPAEVQCNIVNKHNMRVCITHKPFDRMENDIENLMAEHRIIGCDAIGVGSSPKDARANLFSVRTFIEKANAIGKTMHENGFTFHYHNHAFEFYRLDDSRKCMMDLLIDDTDPDYFNFIPDVAWMHYAERNPVDILKRMKGRIKVLHFKDYVFDENDIRHFVPLGQGLVNLDDCYKIACELEIPYIMYEHDSDWPDNDPFKACEESWKYMMRLDMSP